MTADTAQPPKDLIGFLDFYLVKKAPFQLPDAAKEWIVKFSPWIILVLTIIVLPVLLALLGISATFLPYAGFGYYYGAWFTYVWVFLLIRVGLDLLALPGLFARKMSGWRLIFYARLVDIVYNVMTYNVLGGIIGGLIGLYILFQIRPLYKD